MLNAVGPWAPYADAHLRARFPELANDNIARFVWVEDPWDVPAALERQDNPPWWCYWNGPVDKPESLIVMGTPPAPGEPMTPQQRQDQALAEHAVDEMSKSW